MALKRIKGLFGDQQGASAVDYFWLVLIVAVIIFGGTYGLAPKPQKSQQEVPKFSMAAPVVRVLSDWGYGEDGGKFRWVKIDYQQYVQYELGNSQGFAKY